MRHLVELTRWPGDAVFKRRNLRTHLVHARVPELAVERVVGWHLDRNAGERVNGLSRHGAILVAALQSAAVLQRELHCRDHVVVEELAPLHDGQ